MDQQKNYLGTHLCSFFAEVKIQVFSLSVISGHDGLWHGHLVGHGDILPHAWMSQSHLCPFGSTPGSISSYNSRTANTDKCPGGFLCLPGHFASWSCVANKHVLCFRMSLVINILQPLQECRFCGLTKCELVEIKDKIFTEDAPALGPWASLRSPKKMVYTKLKSSVK